MRIRGEESKLDNAANPTFSIFHFPFSISSVLGAPSRSYLLEPPADVSCF